MRCAAASIRRPMPKSSRFARQRPELGQPRLDGCTIWVTLEPCAMCAGAMSLARLDARAVRGRRSEGRRPGSRRPRVQPADLPPSARMCWVASATRNRPNCCGNSSRNGADSSALESIGACEPRRSSAIINTNAMSDPSPIPWLDVVIILALVALNGVLSMSELAIVSSREARLKAMAKERQQRRAMRARPRFQPGPVPFHGADRNHARRHLGRRLFRRCPRWAGRRAHRTAGLRAGDRRDDRVRHRHRPDDFRLAGDRRDRSEAIRASLARADRGRSSPGRCAGFHCDRRRSSGCSTGPAR